MQQAAEAPEGMPFGNDGQQQSSAPEAPGAGPDAQSEPQAPPGLNWNVGRILNVVGVGFLVLGAVFLLTYSWQFLPTFVRVALGMLAAIGLIGGGEYLTIHKDTNKWFGQGLVAGGYALGYFVIFAMHNVAPLKVITNPLIDVCLLLGWTAATFQHAMFRNSQFMAILGACVAMLCVILNPLTVNSIGAFALLTVGMAYCATKKRWLGLHTAACIAPYMAYSACFVIEHLSLIDLHIPSLTSLGFLTVVWLANAISTFTLAEESDSSGLVGANMVLNSILFGLLGMATLNTGLHGFRFIFLNAVGGFYWRTAHLFRTRATNLEAISKFNGLTLLTAAIPLELVNIAVPAFLLSESALLVFAGLKFKQKIYRLFAFLLSTYTWIWIIFGVLPYHQIVGVLGLDVQWPFVIGALAVVAYGFSTWCYRAPQFKEAQTPTESSLGSIAYILAMCTVALAVPVSMPGEPLATLIWPITGLLLIAAGFALGDKEYRAIGLTFFAAATLKLVLFDLSAATTIQRSLSFVLAGIAFLGGSSTYAWLGHKVQSKTAPAP